LTSSFLSIQAPRAKAIQESCQNSASVENKFILMKIILFSIGYLGSLGIKFSSAKADQHTFLEHFCAPVIQICLKELFLMRLFSKKQGRTKMFRTQKKVAREEHFCAMRYKSL
jgi:hypothetical protein